MRTNTSWLEPVPPWIEPASANLCADLGVSQADVPVVELLSAPCGVHEVIAIRAGRYIPAFGLGATRAEAVRLLANVVRALGNNADPRGADYALDLAMHPIAGPAPLRALALDAAAGSVPTVYAEFALAYVQVLGASDALRERVARELGGPRSTAMELSLALGAGGGDYGSFREHYAALTSSTVNDQAPVRLARAWFDFVLARRFAGLDALHAMDHGTALDPASRWLAASADLVNGDDSARARMAEIAESIVAPVAGFVPRLMSVAAREMAEIVTHPLRLRFHHLRCAAGRDHAAVSIRAWLTAATEGEPEEPHEASGRELGPEPTRAARAAIEARTAAGEFLLDWFVPDRDAREAMDLFARRALRLYHRLRGAQTLARVEHELRPPGGMLTTTERIVWGPTVTR
ncbi:MAG: hypothetical protein WCJ30_07775 [Deltaproteobacteria bacterium]